MTETILLIVLVLLAAGSAYAWHVVRIRRLTLERLSEPPAAALGPLPDLPFLNFQWWWPPLLGVGIALLCLLVLHWLVVLSLTLGVVATIIGYQLESVRVVRKGLRIEEQLADALDLMVATLRAGAGVLSALEYASQEAAPPLKQQLEEVLARIRYGEDAQQVLRGLEQRVPLETFRLFCTALSVHWETGGTLSPTLATVGRVIRDRIEVTRRLRAQSAQAQASTIAVLLSTYVLGLVIWRSNPAGMEQFLATTFGQYAIAGVVLLQAIGLLWSQLLARLRY